MPSKPLNQTTPTKPNTPLTYSLHTCYIITEEFMTTNFADVSTADDPPSGKGQEDGGFDDTSTGITEQTGKKSVLKGMWNAMTGGSGGSGKKKNNYL